jgi:hypothetical protein
MKLNHYFRSGSLLDRNPEVYNQVARFYRDENIQISIFNNLVKNLDSLEIVIDQLSTRGKNLEISQYLSDDYSKYCCEFKITRFDSGIRLQLIGVKEPEQHLVRDFQENIITTLSRLQFRLSAVGSFILDD